jgi:hypothetical protein
MLASLPGYYDTSVPILHETRAIDMASGRAPTRKWNSGGGGDQLVLKPTLLEAAGSVFSV